MTPFELKLTDEGRFSGYASTFGGPPDSYGDIVEKGAFADTLKEWKTDGALPLMLLQHGMGTTVEDSLPIGVWTSMAEDNHGLYVEGKLANTRRGRDVYELMKLRAIAKLSIGFKTRKAAYFPKTSDARRKLLNVKLLETSLVVNPANPRATIDSVRSADSGDRVLAALQRLSAELRA